MMDLTHPLSDDTQAGVWLRGDRAAFRKLRNAFNAGQTAYRALSETPEAMADRSLQEANAAAWAALAEIAAETLSTTSRDFEVACWLIAARMHGTAPFRHAAASLGELAGLVEEHFDTLHPIPPEDKLQGATEAEREAEIVAGKLRPFVQLFGETDGGGLLIRPLSTAPAIGEVSYLDAVAAEKSGTFDALAAAARSRIAADPGEAEALRAQLAELRDATARIDKALAARARAVGAGPPVVGYVERFLGDMQRILDLLAPPPAAETGPSPEPAANAGADDAPVAAGAGRVAGAAIGDREQAVNAIAALAAHFRATEPHSPVHTLLARAVRWARMPAAGIYAEILGTDSTGLAQITLMTGLESDGATHIPPLPAARPVAAVALPVAPPPLPAPAAAPALPDAPEAGAAEPDPPQPSEDLNAFEW